MLQNLYNWFPTFNQLLQQDVIPNLLTQVFLTLSNTQFDVFNENYTKFSPHNICVYKWKPKVWIDERLTRFKLKQDWIHNNKLNDDCRIQFDYVFYSWRRKLAVVDFLGINESPSTTVGSPLWLCASYHYAEFWIIGSPFRVVSLLFNSRDVQDIYRLTFCAKRFIGCKLISLWNFSVSRYQ